MTAILPPYPGAEGEGWKLGKAIMALFNGYNKNKNNNDTPISNKKASGPWARMQTWHDRVPTLFALCLLLPLLPLLLLHLYPHTLRGPIVGLPELKQDEFLVAKMSPAAAFPDAIAQRAFDQQRATLYGGRGGAWA